jgi:hypothetical protein
MIASYNPFPKSPINRPAQFLCNIALPQLFNEPDALVLPRPDEIRCTTCE